MANLMEPVGPWLRDRTFMSESGPAPFVSPAEVLITDGDVTVVMDVPGLRAESLEIEIENDTLTVRGERPYPYGDDGEGERRVWRRSSARSDASSAAFAYRPAATPTPSRRR